jgi:hypothetical protein
VGNDGSGGKAAVHHSGARPVQSKTAQAQAPDAKLFRIGQNASEPTLGTMKNGDVFITAFQTNTRVEVVRSQDAGKSWDIVSPKLGPRNAQLLSLDPYLYVDPATDRVYTIDLTVACAYLSYSDDHGDSWTTNPLACGQPVNDHQSLFAGPPVVSPTVGYKNIVYYCWNDVGSSSCSKSLDGGITFSSTGAPAFPGVDPDASDQQAQLCGGLAGHGFVGSDGTVFLPKGHCGQPWLAISHDEGRTWTRVRVASNGVRDHEAGVATDAKGNIYYDYVGKDGLPYLVISKDGGKHWSKPLEVGPPGLTEANLPGIAVGAPGKVAMVYMGSENSPGAQKDGGSRDSSKYKNVTWNGYMTMTANAFAKDPVFYSGSVNDPKDPFIRGQCGPGRCAAVYDFIDIVIAQDGTPWGAFVDGCISICAAPTGGSDLGSDGVVGRLVGGPSLR